jgi:hypothetical protein
MAAFQPYTGAFSDGRQDFRWSCYATCPVYELRALDATLPAAPAGRKWVSKRQHGQSGPRMALLVDHKTDDFSHMLAQIVEPRSFLVDV